MIGEDNYTVSQEQCPSESGISGPMLVFARHSAFEDQDQETICSVKDSPSSNCSWSFLFMCL